MRKGTNEVSSPPGAWRLPAFDDSKWSALPAPFHFGEAGITGGTRLTDMQQNYSCIFLRQTFTLTNLTEVIGLTLLAASDDGYVAWLNGQELPRYRVNPGTLAFTNLANSSAPEPVQFLGILLTNLQGVLLTGSNVLAVQAFNRAIDNGDFQINVGLESHVRDNTPPTILQVQPEPGAVGALTQFTVVFSEAVQGVDEEDLLINGVPASRVTSLGTASTFYFPQPAYGPVIVAWAASHSIEDLAIPPNPLADAAANAEWRFQLVDLTSPLLTAVFPPAGSTVSTLGQIEISFNEPVVGVHAADLLINGQPATNIAGIAAGPYRFAFAPEEGGVVQVQWQANHGVTDLASPPNAFVASAWSYTVDPAATNFNVVINEMLAVNLDGLADEDGEQQDWIEIHSRQTKPVNLAGWALTDDAGNPDKWVFPALTLQPNQYLVVFASGKDRRETGPNAKLHTNFKLAPAGEYLGLYNHECPRRLVSELAPEYPSQRPNYSYGRIAGDQFRYLSQPTPGSANTTSALTGVVSQVRFSVGRGFFNAPFDLALSNAFTDAVIRYTTNCSEPTESNGQVYSNPLRISRTTAVRAAAFKNGLLPSRTTTTTYVFLEDVLRQPALPTGFPAQWGSSRVATGDYEMDPQVVLNPLYTNLVRQGFQALPALCLSMKVDDWFSPATGIYSNGDKEGLSWERRGAAELVFPKGEDGFHINCGIRIQGGTSTQPWKCYKLSMRLVFRSDYGSSKLDFPLFQDSPVTEFDTLVLDAHLNLAWAYAGGSAPEEQRRRAQYVRDQYVCDLQNATGTAAVHGRYVHLFLNGLYWGLYDAHEEPEASFAAAYFGGQKEEYDVLKHTGNNVLDGNGLAWQSLMSLARSGLSSDAQYQAIQEVLDVPSLIDYMLVHFYVGNVDWPHHNWYAFRRRIPAAKFYFSSWDSEHVLKGLMDDRTGVANADSPAELYSLLRSNAEFRLLFADHAHRHFFNGGIFYVAQDKPAWDPSHPERNVPAAIYHQRIAEVDPAVVCESARWGDNQRPDQPYTRNNEWLAELNWMRTTYFPSRSAVVLNQLRGAGLYPKVAAPTFNQHGGYVPNGFSLTITAPAGTIYFTLDGTDPRTPVSGTPAPAAGVYRSGTPIKLTNSIPVKARVLAGGVWSALNEANFHVAELGTPLRLTELMYNPPGGEAYEFLELVNTGPAPLDLGGYSVAGIQFLFPSRTLVLPGQVVLLISDLNVAAFQARYPHAAVDGTFSGTLSNGGEKLVLKDPFGRTVWTCEYRDDSGWPEAPDGRGYSLEAIDPDESLNDPANWRPSMNPGGSPGVWMPFAPAPEIRLNELYAGYSPYAASGPTPSPPGTPPLPGTESDWIELLNVGTNAVVLADWSLTDDGNPGKYVFPTGTVLAPGDYLLVKCGRAGEPSGLQAAFGLDQDGETISLFDGSTSRVDSVTLGLQVAGYSLGRTAAGTWVLCLPTAGAANVPAELASPTNLVVNEWLANPLPGEDDWLELFNKASLPVALKGLYLSTSNELARVQSHSFIAPQGYVRLWADEQGGVDHLDFRLPAAGGMIALLDAVGTPIDRMIYASQAEDRPLGRLPDGSPSVMVLGAHTPGRPNQNAPEASDRDADGLPDSWEIAHQLDPREGKGAEGAWGDPDQDGLNNSQEYVAGTHPKDPASRLAFLGALFQPDGLHLQFVAVAQKSYTIEVCDSLPAGNWRKLSDIQAQPSTGVADVTDPQGSAEKARFYRLVVPASP
jgi:hypothetical protein